MNMDHDSPAEFDDKQVDDRLPAAQHAPRPRSSGEPSDESDRDAEAAQQQQARAQQQAPQQAPLAAPRQEEVTEPSSPVPYEHIKDAWLQHAYESEAFIQGKFNEAHKTMQHMYAAYFKTHQIIVKAGQDELEADIAKVEHRIAETATLEQALQTYWEGMKRLADEMSKLRK